MASERADGWYWVKDKEQFGGKWIIAEWRGDVFWECGFDTRMYDASYAQIGERIPDHE